MCTPSPPLKDTRETIYANHDVYTWLGLLLFSYDSYIRVGGKVENVAVQQLEYSNYWHQNKN